jgi:hypothetical protein
MLTSLGDSLLPAFGMDGSRHAPTAALLSGLLKDGRRG